MGLGEGSMQTLRTAIICHFNTFLYFHRVLDGKFFHKHVNVADMEDTSPVNILKDPPQIATEGFSMVLRPEGFLE